MKGSRDAFLFKNIKIVYSRLHYSLTVANPYFDTDTF